MDEQTEKQSNPLGIKSIAEHNKLGNFEQAKETSLKVLHYDWIFSTPIEKVLVAGAVLWTCWSIGKWIMGLFA